MRKRFRSMFVSVLGVILLASASAMAANTQPGGATMQATTNATHPKPHWVHRTHKSATQSAQPGVQQGHPKPHWVMRSHTKVSNAPGGMPSGAH